MAKADKDEGTLKEAMKLATKVAKENVEKNGDVPDFGKLALEALNRGVGDGKGQGKGKEDDEKGSKKASRRKTSY